MNLYDRLAVSVVETTLFDRVLSNVLNETDEYRESPSDLPEKLVLGAVKSGRPLGKHAEVEKLSDFKAKRPEFKALEKEGFVKHAAVFRSGVKDAETRRKEAIKKLPKKERQKANQQQEKGDYEGRSISVHYWEHPDGRRVNPKFTNDSPGQPADRL